MKAEEGFLNEKEESVRNSILQQREMHMEKIEKMKLDKDGQFQNLFLIRDKTLEVLLEMKFENENDANLIQLWKQTIL